MALPAFFRKSSLRVLLLSLFVLQVLFAAGLTAFFSYFHSVNAVNEIAGQLCSEIMSRVEQRLDSYLDTAQSINQTNVHLASQGLLDVADVTSLSHYFWEQGQIFKGLGTIAFAGREGNFIGANEPENYIVLADRRLTNGSIRRYAPTDKGYLSKTILRERQDYDARKREWFKKAKAANRPVWTPINPSVTGARLDLTATTPYYDSNDTFQGIFLTDVSLSNFSSFMQSLRIGKTGQAFIIERDWNIVATSFKELPFVMVDQEKGEVSRLAAGQSKSPLVAAAAKLLAKKIADPAGISGQIRMLVTINNQKNFLQLSPYRKDNLNFLTVVVIPTADFMTHIESSRRTNLWLIGIAAVLALGLGALMSEWIVAPIRKLASAAKKIGDGQWHEHVPVGRHDEVGELASTFNTMADRLQETIDQLHKENAARKENEIAIRKALDVAEDEREKTKAIIAAIGDGISIQDTDFKVLYQNRIHQQMLGDHQSEYCYRGYENEGKVCEGCPLALTFNDGQIHRVERSLSRPDGIRHLEITTSPVRDFAGQIISGIEVVRDITTRRKMEEALAEEKERLAVALRSIGDGVITTDTSGKIVLLNSIAEQLTGWTTADAAGRPLEEVFHIINEQTGEACKNPVNKVLSNGRIVGMTNPILLVRKDGKVLNIVDSGAPILDAQEKIIGVVLVFRDVTEQLKTEKELLKVKKLESVGVLAGGIAHDFNNILAAILGNINLALIDKKLQEKTRNHLTKAEKAILRAKGLTQQLLTFSKGGEPVKETASLEAIIRDSANFILHGGKAACQYEIPEDLWLVDIDKGQISQVIQNIVLNASDAMPEGGVIRIHGENLSSVDKNIQPYMKSGQVVKICIEDSGIGIPPSLMDKIFDPYFTTKQQGNGLGLAITQSIIAKHDGYLAVASTVGKGSTFSIFLPASNKPAAEKNDAPVEANTFSPAKILVMDDDEMVQDISEQMLQQMGHEVTLAEHGAKAVQLYEEAMKAGRPFDLVILDLTIPGGMGGKDTVREILARHPEARVIASSGYSNDPIIANCREYGFCAAISKPYRFEDLSRLISQALHST